MHEIPHLNTQAASNSNETYNLDTLGFGFE